MRAELDALPSQIEEARAVADAARDAGSAAAEASLEPLQAQVRARWLRCSFHELRVRGKCPAAAHQRAQAVAPATVLPNVQFHGCAASVSSAIRVANAAWGAQVGQAEAGMQQLRERIEELGAQLSSADDAAEMAQVRAPSATIRVTCNALTE